MLEALFQPIHLLVIVIIALVVIAPIWQIFKKAGFSPWLSLLTLLPVVGLFTLYYVAFTRWPDQNLK
jgi:hypothetical protein